MLRNSQAKRADDAMQQEEEEGEEEAEPEAPTAAAAAETTLGATEAGMEVNAGTVQRQRLWHLATLQRV